MRRLFSSAPPRRRREGRRARCGANRSRRAPPVVCAESESARNAGATAPPIRAPRAIRNRSFARSPCRAKSLPRSPLAARRRFRFRAAPPIPNRRAAATTPFRRAIFRRANRRLPSSADRPPRRARAKKDKTPAEKDRVARGARQKPPPTPKTHRRGERRRRRRARAPPLRSCPPRRRFRRAAKAARSRPDFAKRFRRRPRPKSNWDRLGARRRRSFFGFAAALRFFAQRRDFAFDARHIVLIF